LKIVVINDCFPAGAQADANVIAQRIGDIASRMFETPSRSRALQIGHHRWAMTSAPAAPIMMSAPPPVSERRKVVANG
jgi:hypothetical protein